MYRRNMDTLKYERQTCGLPPVTDIMFPKLNQLHTARPFGRLKMLPHMLGARTEERVFVFPLPRPRELLHTDRRRSEPAYKDGEMVSCYWMASVSNSGVSPHDLLSIFCLPLSLPVVKTLRSNFGAGILQIISLIASGMVSAITAAVGDTDEECGVYTSCPPAKLNKTLGELQGLDGLGSDWPTDW